jgi:hypothetical protein
MNLACWNLLKAREVQTHSQGSTRLETSDLKFHNGNFHGFHGGEKDMG